MSGAVKSARARWRALVARYAGLTRRERGLVALGLLVAPALLVNALWAGPVAERTKRLRGVIAQQQGSHATLQTQVAQLQQDLASDPDAAKKAEVAALEQRVAGMDSQLADFGATLVSPAEMNGLLEGLLARHRGLRLVSLKTLAPQSVLAGEKKAAPGETAEKSAKIPVDRSIDLYRHGVEIRLEGRFVDLHAYLAQLEQLPQKLLWSGLRYRVTEYPQAEMTLTVHTLSAERSWLSL